MKTLEKIFGIIRLAGLITLGAGLIAKNKTLDYIGAGTVIAGTWGYIITCKDKPYKKIKWDIWMN